METSFGNQRMTSQIEGDGKEEVEGMMVDPQILTQTSLTLRLTTKEGKIFLSTWPSVNWSWWVRFSLLRNVLSYIMYNPVVIISYWYGGTSVQ